MNSPGHHPAPPPPRRWRALLVLGLLAGLFGMHALAPMDMDPSHEHTRNMTSMAAVVVHAGCPDGDGCGSGHVHHPDPTCAAAAITGGPALPALVADPAAVPDGAPTTRTYALTGPDGGRVPPPSLAELQLLRI